MDTNDLSSEAYNGLILTAERFHHDLTLQFGVRAEYCKTEGEYLNVSEKMITEWLNEPNAEYIIEVIFFDNPPNKTDFKNILLKILKNISKVRKIDISRRKFD
jgi:hypothetical protein